MNNGGKPTRWGSNIVQSGLTDAVIIRNPSWSPSEAEVGDEEEEKQKRWDRRCKFSDDDDSRATATAAVVRFPIRGAVRAVIRVGNVTARLSEDEAGRMELLLLGRPTISWNSERCPNLRNSNNDDDNDDNDGSYEEDGKPSSATVAALAAAPAAGNSTSSRHCNRRRVLLPIYSECISATVFVGFIIQHSFRCQCRLHRGLEVWWLRL
jgi:hypothetical protein